MSVIEDKNKIYKENKAKYDAAMKKIAPLREKEETVQIEVDEAKIKLQKIRDEIVAAEEEYGVAMARVMMAKFAPNPKRIKAETAKVG